MRQIVGCVELELWWVCYLIEVTPGRSCVMILVTKEEWYLFKNSASQNEFDCKSSSVTMVFLHMYVVGLLWRAMSIQDCYPCWTLSGSVHSLSNWPVLSESTGYSTCPD